MSFLAYALWLVLCWAAASLVLALMIGVPSAIAAARREAASLRPQEDHP